MVRVRRHDEESTFILENEHLTFRYDAARALYSIENTGAEVPCIRGATAYVSCRDAQGSPVGHASGRARDHGATPVRDAHGQGQEVRFTRTATGGLEITLVARMYHDRPFILLRLVARNGGRLVVFTESFVPLHASPGSGSAVTGASPSEAPAFFKVGWHDWCYTGLRHADERDVRTLIKPFVGKMYFNPSTPIPLRRGRFWSEGWGILAGKDHAIVAGLASMADQFGQVYADCLPGSHELKVVSQADGVPLPPGEERASEWVYVQFVRLPCHDPAGEYADAVARQMNARVPRSAPAKWTHWYHYFHNITERAFSENLNTIHGIRDVVPFKTVQLDDGYQSAWGDWYTCNDKFPGGLASLASSISKKGFTPGLWVAPFVADPKSKLAAAHPGWLVKDRKGKPIVSGYFWDFFGHSLDTTNPEVLDWVRELMRTIVREWGFGFVKTDFVYAGALPGVRHDKTLTRAQAFRKGMEAVREGIGRDTFLLGCGCPFGPSIGIVDAMRVGPDTAPNWAPYLWNMKWATPLLKYEKGIGCLRNNVRQTLNLSAVHRRWWWSDPDCLMVRNYDTRLTEDEIRSNVTLIGLQGGLFINSDDLTRLSQDRQRMMGLLLPILSPGGRPLDLLQREMAEFYHLPMERTWGTWHLAAVFNWGDRPGTRALNLESLGLDPGGEYHLFDFWSGEYRLHRGANVELGPIPAHGCRLLRLCRNDGAPCVAGSTLHITQGGEVDRFSVSGRKASISVMDLGRAARGEILVWLPKKLRTATVKGRTVPVREMAGNAWRIQVEAKAAFSVDLSW